MPVGPALDSPLIQGLTHLYTPSLKVNSVTGEIIRIASGAVTTRARRIGLVTSSLGMYFSDSASRINAGKPWTIIALMRVDPSIAGVSSYFINTSSTAGTNGSPFDRSLGFTFPGPGIALQGSVFDGAVKTVTHQTQIAYTTGEQVFTAVISCSDGFLRCFYNGVPGTTETAVSNNGASSYSSAFLNIGMGGTGYEYGIVGRFDGVAWKEAQARRFAENPWQLFAPLARRIWVPGTAGGSQAESGGSSASVVVTAVGAGTAVEGESGGSSASVVVTAVGAGTALELVSGGASASVVVSAVGAGNALELVSGGSSAGVVVTAVGAGLSSEDTGVGVYPSPATVLAGVQYGPSGVEYTGTMDLLTAAEAAEAVAEYTYPSGLTLEQLVRNIMSLIIVRT